MQKRITELETRLAFQEDTLQTLNEIVTRQQLEIDSLIQQVSNLREQMRNLVPSLIANASEETPPPHY